MKFLQKYMRFFENEQAKNVGRGGHPMRLPGSADKTQYNILIANDEDALSAWNDILPLNKEEATGASISPYTHKLEFFSYKGAPYSAENPGIRISFGRGIFSKGALILKNSDGTWQLDTAEQTKSPLVINEDNTTLDELLKSMAEQENVSYFFNFDKEKIKKYQTETGEFKSRSTEPIKITFSDGEDTFGDKLIKILGVDKEMSGLAKALRFMWALAVARKANRYLDEAVVLNLLLDKNGQSNYWGKKIEFGERYILKEQITELENEAKQLDELRKKPIEELSDEEKNRLGFRTMFTELMDISSVGKFLKICYEKLGLTVRLIKGKFAPGYRSRGAEKDSEGDYVMGIDINPIFNMNKKGVMAAAIYAYQMKPEDINLNDIDFKKKLTDIIKNNVTAILKKKATSIEVMLSKRNEFSIQDGKVLHTDVKEPRVYFVEFSQKAALERLLLMDKESIMYKIFKEGSSGKRLIIEDERKNAAFVFNLILDFTEKLSKDFKEEFKDSFISSEKSDSYLQKINDSVKYAIDKSKYGKLIKRILEIINPDLIMDLYGETVEPSKPTEIEAPTQAPTQEAPTQEPPSEEDDDELKGLLL
jgi:hypothetical protein